MPRALISVSNKQGVEEFAAGLQALGWEIVSTGGTAKALEKAGIAVIPIEAVTLFPEMLDGRVKTLHPAIHAAILARRDVPDHIRTLEVHGFSPIDLVAVNLYPFRETITRPDVQFEEAIEQIDIGGPALLRSAAKNHRDVLVVVDPRDYPRVLDALRDGRVDTALRRELAAKVFRHTATYDSAIAGYLSGPQSELPETLALVLDRRQILRYGENPEQRAALYRLPEPGGIADLVQLQGKELSFNNLLDIDAALFAVSCFGDRTACAIIKHTTPCGISLGRTPEEAYRRALACDPVSAFGSVIGFNTAVDQAAARAMAELFVEVVVAPAFEPAALELFKKRKNLRVVQLPATGELPSLDFKGVRGGLLVQDRFRFDPREATWKVATDRAPTDDEWRDLRFAWRAVASVKSNAILLARDETAVGIGAGQMSRVDAVFLAIHKARQAGHDPTGAVLASDAFFPFPDGVEEAGRAGVTAVIQPGGSVRDAEVIEAANRCGMAMVLTGKRQFRH
ncbi:MAG: bifunctional purine biosynthesis protein PurH [Gemmatimonadales bacterium]|nr:MAG: bifunctional purine biosynthesis protein PurH [Gemmatimonadales bacterium]